MVDGPLLRRVRAVAPLVLTVHDTDPFNGDPSAALQASGFRRCLDGFDQLVVHTAQGEARLRAMGVPADRVTVLPHGMLAAPAPGSADAMDSTLTFLLFGKIKPYKGADLLIEAFAALPDDLRGQARVRIVGKPYMDIASLHALATSLGVAVAIEPGFVADDAVAELFGRNTVAMFPYREIEASGVMFLALAHGRPVIASRLGSFAELLTDGQHGHLLPPGDVGALTTAMAHMIADRAFSAQCSAAIDRLATEIPSWEEIGRRTVQTYRKACAPAALAAAGFQPAAMRG
jgi:glycosyltransferase involved in cell wall biosynthesis